MAYTLNQTILYAQSKLATYIPMTAQTGSEPALSIANEIVAFMQGPPWTWPTNRKEDTSLVTVAGTQDYVLSLTDFGFLETVTLTDSNSKSVEVKNVYNSKVLGLSSEQNARPNSVCVKLITPATSIALRFLSAPDQVYTGTTTYQKIPNFFTVTTQDWFTQANIPQNQMHIYNNLFLSEAYQLDGNEQSAAIYRRRGMAALLAMAEGLTEMQKNMIFAQAMYSDLQTLAANLRTQAAQQARTI